MVIDLSDFFIEKIFDGYFAGRRIILYNENNVEIRRTDMSFFDKNNESASPIGLLRAHTGTFMYYVKMGKAKFKNKGTVYDIFFDMDQTQFLLDQATRGTLYDFKKKIDYPLWDAAVHKYSDDLKKLKAELLRLVEEGFSAEPEAKTEIVEEKEPKEKKNWKMHILDEMEEAEKEGKRLEKEAADDRAALLARMDDRQMSEADCRELWRIIKELDKEFRAMNRIADDWFAVNGKGKGCAAAVVMFMLIPVGCMYGILSIF